MKHHIVQLLQLILCLSFGQSRLLAGDSARLKLKDFYVLNGTQTQPDAVVNLNDFRHIAPTSDILKQDYSTYTPSLGRYSYSSGAFSMLLGFEHANKKNQGINPNRQLRVGVSYAAITEFSTSMYRTDSKRFDTISSPYGPIYYDSIRSRSMKAEYAFQQLCLDVSYLYKTDAAARWSLFGGIGITAGMSLNTSVKVTSSDQYYVLTSYYGNRIYPGYRVGETEIYRAKSNYGGSVYIPLGVDFRIGKKSPFWHRLHVFLEGRPGISFLSIPELVTLPNVYMRTTIGLRVRLK